MFLSPNQTIKELGSKEEFEMYQKIDSLQSSFEEDEDGDDLLEEKLSQNYQEEMASNEEVID